MKPWQWGLTLFSLFVAIMLAKQMYDYNNDLASRADVPEAHRFYNQQGDPNATVTITASHAAQLYQKTFSSEPETGGMMFKGSATVVNRGTAKSVDAQIFIRPYRGAQRGNETTDGGRGPHGMVPENDAISQIGQWVSIPDLAPGESTTVSADFILRHDVMIGNNPDPQINFGTEKPDAAKP